MATKWTGGGVARGLAVGIGILVGSLAGPGEGWAQMGASRGMPAPSGSAQSKGQVTAPGHQRHQVYDNDGDRHRDRDRHSSWDHHNSHRPHWGYHSGYAPQYYYPGPYGSYPGRWVWDGRNWLFVPIY